VSHGRSQWQLCAPEYWQVPATQRAGIRHPGPVAALHAAPSAAAAVQVPGVVALAPAHTPSASQLDTGPLPLPSPLHATTRGHQATTDAVRRTMVLRSTTEVFARLEGPSASRTTEPSDFVMESSDFVAESSDPLAASSDSLAESNDSLADSTDRRAISNHRHSESTQSHANKRHRLAISTLQEEM
jgi:hypothetical protein